MDINELTKYGLPTEYVSILKERGIQRLNPVQTEAVNKGLFENVNMLVSAPTASGKTLIAEMALVKTVLKGRTGVYLSPLRALASEKYDEFKVLEKLNFRIGITTGDYDQPAEYLSDNDIIIATYERFDSIFRLKPTWLSKVGLIVIDELHNVSDPERGPIIEMIVARALKYGIRVLGLSATISNPDQLANWIKGEIVASNWRPVRLVEGVFDKKKSEIVFMDGRREKVEDIGEDSVLNMVLHNLKSNYQTLVFVHNRKKVEEYAEITSKYLNPYSSREISRILEELDAAPTRIERDLLSELIAKGVAFHHAGLSHISRKVIEEAFRSKVIKVVYATPTLAAGVNLPARRVLVSIKRYDSIKGRRTNISISEYKQMAGRAGRPQYDELGESIIIDASSIEEGFKYISLQPEPVEGNFLSDRSLRIHVLSAIASEEARTVEEIAELFNYTYTAKTSRNKNIINEIGELLEFLENLGMIKRFGNKINSTRLGRITSYSYVDPLTVSIYIKYKPASYSDLYMLHLVTLTPDFTRSAAYVPSKVIAMYEELAEVYSNNGLLMPMSTEFYDYDDWLRGFIHALALNDWINEKSEDEIVNKYMLGPGDLYNMKDTASWITNALGKIAGILGDISYNKKLLELSQRIEKGVKTDALELASLKYIGRVRARLLIEHGIKSLEDLAKIPKKRLAMIPTFGQKIAEEIHRQLKELGFNVT
ncbi:MAG: DEAD/DEAH box helicase [Desulfurococcaceae archaeon]